ncbi:uncharacterized protein ASPGLDRAFT_587354 [Aspergillus glaucus CBS 516.65]|uniref:MACPF-like domain-containing protein n=1 Tax=Aspergillus glaucus CBS 516.65 TaxID=1160497 RepID=A0A1L9VCS9_ASPGL|nr:hypothetical protein ASPGLDRAFT_587354 [Aspergillus glaucus CBS 516.65]OJJ81751.1 hypothetical protein ASPGLDRAFT_587354 [Aspergillus glaucus CBS 516.65]
MEPSVRTASELLVFVLSPLAVVIFKRSYIQQVHPVAPFHTIQFPFLSAFQLIMATPSKQDQVLRVHRYDPSSKTSKQKQIVQLNADQTIKGKTLKDIREILVSNHVFDSKDLKSPFCERDGSDVGDDMKVELYLALLGIKSSDVPNKDIYFKTKKLFTNVDEATKAFISQKLDLAFENPPEVLKKNPELLTSAFDPSNWKAVQGKLNHAADLSEKEWSVITRENCLLSGHHVITDVDNKTPRRVERSAYNAFTLRPREFEAYEISSKNTDPGKYKCRIPHYRVDDYSSVTVVETKNAFQKSLADSSFAEGSFQIAGAAAMGPVSAGAKVGVGGGTSQNTGKDNKTNEQNLVVNYNFPRVTLHWDPVCLDITDECLEDIRKVKNPDTLGDFHNKYGLLFARRVQLGGRLSSSKAKSADSSASSVDEASKFKAEVSASVSSFFTQASLNASHERQNQKTTESSEQNFKNSIAWEATGGDTLLCNNPPQWCATVGQYKYWRVVNQEDAVPLYHFLSCFPQAGREIIERFELSAKDKLTPQDEKRLNKSVETRMEDLKEGMKKKGHQTFQLIEQNTGCSMSVVEGTDDIIKYLENSFHTRFISNASEHLDKVKKTGACIKCNSKASGKTTEFMARKRFGEGEEPALKFWEPFNMQSCGDIFLHIFVSGTRTTSKTKATSQTALQSTSGSAVKVNIMNRKLTG